MKRVQDDKTLLSSIKMAGSWSALKRVGFMGSVIYLVFILPMWVM